MFSASISPVSQQPYAGAFLIGFAEAHVELRALRSWTCPQKEMQIKTYRCEKSCCHVEPIPNFSQIKSIFSTFNVNSLPHTLLHVLGVFMMYLNLDFLII